MNQLADFLAAVRTGAGRSSNANGIRINFGRYEDVIAQQSLILEQLLGTQDLINLDFLKFGCLSGDLQLFLCARIRDKNRKHKVSLKRWGRS